MTTDWPAKTVISINRLLILQTQMHRAQILSVRQSFKSLNYRLSDQLQALSCQFFSLNCHQNSCSPLQTLFCNSITLSANLSHRIQAQFACSISFSEDLIPLQMNQISSYWGSIAMPGQALNSANISDIYQNTKVYRDFMRLTYFTWMYCSIFIFSYLQAQNRVLVSLSEGRFFLVNKSLRYLLDLSVALLIILPSPSSLGNQACCSIMKQQNFRSWRQYLLCLRSFKYSSIQGTSQVISIRSWKYKLQVNTGIICPPNCELIWATKESNQLSLRMTISMEIFFSVLKVYIMMRRSSSIFWSLSLTWIFNFLRYSARRIDSSRCFCLSAGIAARSGDVCDDDIIISPYCYIIVQQCIKDQHYMQERTTNKRYRQDNVQGEQLAEGIEQPDGERMDKQQQFQKLIQVLEPSPNNLSPPTTSYHILDKLLIIVSILLLIAAITSYLYIQYQANLQLQAQNAQKLNEKKWSAIYTASYLKEYGDNLLKQKAASAVSAQYHYTYQRQLRENIAKLRADKCAQYQSVQFYELMQDLINPYEQQFQQQEQNRKVDEQIKKISQQHEEDGDAYLSKQQKQLKIKQQKQQQQVANMNRQQRDPNSLEGKSFRGISEQKIASAKQYKTLTTTPPWQSTPLSQQEYEYYHKVYKIGEYSKELPFCIVVPTFNNEDKERYKYNIDSIVQQNYTNYHVVIIDDASTDKTGVLIDEHVKLVKAEWGKRGKILDIVVYHNKEQRRAMPNIRKAALEYCKPNEIFVIVDGDDQLIGRQVLKLFNSQFQVKNCWFAYSNFMSFVGNVGFSGPFKAEVVDENRYRQANFLTSHLRAFYTQLLRLIKQEDLKDDQGEYLRAANDVAICIPILEMAHKRVTYIPELTYLYNSNTGLNNHLIRIREQIDNSKLIRKRNKYFPLDELKFEGYSIN